jgi:hypothetical protein
LNTGFYENLDTNFKEAFEMVQKEFSHDELISMLQNGNIPQKQIAALRLDDIFSANEANILIKNLTGCDGKIREAVALKIRQLLPQKVNYFKEHALTFADASIDINANICRLVIDSVSIIKQNNTDFSEIYFNKLISFINETFSELDKFIFRDKKYVINKQLFKLYWCLESLKLFSDTIDKDLLLSILERACKEKEYTIREKVAEIIFIQKDERFNNLKIKLQNDENYYVKSIFIK